MGAIIAFLIGGGLGGLGSLKPNLSSKKHMVEHQTVLCFQAAFGAAKIGQTGCAAELHTLWGGVTNDGRDNSYVGEPPTLHCGVF